VQIAEQRQGAVTVLKPTGPICQADADELRARLSETLVKTQGRYVLDASGVPYVDSRGLEVLVEASEELAASGGVLKLCGATETVREALEVTDLASLFEHYADETTAVRSFL